MGGTYEVGRPTMAGEAHEGPIGRGDLASLTSAVGRPRAPNDHDDVGGLARGPVPMDATDS
jgi:hypothetical protein